MITQSKQLKCTYSVRYQRSKVLHEPIRTHINQALQTMLWKSVKISSGQCAEMGLDSITPETSSTSIIIISANKTAKEIISHVVERFPPNNPSVSYYY